MVNKLSVSLQQFRKVYFWKMQLNMELLQKNWPVKDRKWYRFI